MRNMPITSSLINSFLCSESIFLKLKKRFLHISKMDKFIEYQDLHTKKFCFSS